MSILRSVYIALLEIEGRPIPIRLRVYAYIEEVKINMLSKIKWYEIKAFCKNLPHFIKQAWYWRDFDSSYSTECFARNLERLGDGLALHDRHIMSKKSAVRCKVAANKLRKAYSGDYKINDVSYNNWTKNNKIYFNLIIDGEHKGMSEMKYKRKYPEDYSEKMYKVIQKRIAAIEKADKQEAWVYIHKYIGGFWD